MTSKAENVGPSGIGVYWTATDIRRAAAMMGAEAGYSASPAHKAAVLSTIENRAADPNFPKSPSSVMAQQNQYEPKKRYGGLDNIPAASRETLGIAVATLDSYRSTRDPAGALDDRYGQVIYFTNPKTTAERGTSHPKAGNIFPEFNKEGHVFTGIKTFNAGLAPVPKNAPIYSPDAQALVDHVRNTPEYHNALASLNTTEPVYRYLAQIETVNVAALRGANTDIAARVEFPSNEYAQLPDSQPTTQLQKISAELAPLPSNGTDFSRLHDIIQEAVSPQKTNILFTPDVKDVVQPQNFASYLPQQNQIRSM